MDATWAEDLAAMRELLEPWSIGVVTVTELEAGVLLTDDAVVRAARLRRLAARRTTSGSPRPRSRTTRRS